MTYKAPDMPASMADAVRAGRFDDLLFHGTCERFNEPLKPGAYDDVCWFAETPAVAQNYIPENGVTTYFSRPYDYELDNRVRPNKGVITGLLKMMGIEVHDVEYDHLGHAKSFPIVAGHPTWADVVAFIEGLGYEPRKGIYELKTHYQKIGETEYELVRRAEYKMPGRVFIAERKGLNLLDMSHAGDANNPAYNWINVFRRAKGQGYDGITISDYAQSKIYGNVGHISHGVFASALPKLTMISIDAVGRDFGDDINEPMTPEFTALQTALAQEAAPDEPAYAL